VIAMPYTPPLTPFITHVADPVDLPLLADGDPGPSRVLNATLMRQRVDGVSLRATMSTGDSLLAIVEAAGEGIIRVRLTPSANTTTRSAAAITLTRPQPCADPVVEVADARVVVRTGTLIAQIDLDPWQLSFRDSTGRRLLTQNGQETDVTHRLRVLPFGRSVGSDGAPIAYHDTFTAQADEHFFGFGEKFTALDKRGQRIVSWNYDAFSSESERSYKNIPFFLSSRGYGLLVDSGLATEFDVCHSTHACVQIVVPDDLLDYYVIAGPEASTVLDGYHRLTGRPAVPPKWALGTWISNGFFRSDQEQTLAVARTIRERGIPCDVLHIDAYWQRRGLWSHMQWDVDQFPDPDQLLRDLTDLGFRTCLWINPYISVEASLFAEGAAKGYFLTSADGSTYVADVWHGAQAACGITDFTNPQATAWFQELLRPLLRQGASLFKTDFGEGVPVDAVAANTMTGEALHNVYSLLFNDAVAEVTEQVAGHRVLWARSSFTGGQRHCGQWAGDTNATYPAMASTLRGGLSYALSGVPLWSHDVGGFTGTPAPDLFVRSAQFGALSPLVRLHGNSTRFPWQFPAQTEQAVREALRLRYRLMPYLYSAVAQAATTGLPVMRPLVLEGLDDPGAWSADLEYLLGPDLLVAPMTDPDGTRQLYLPPGQWVDYWTGEVHEGRRHLRVNKPLGQVPLFVRWCALIATTQPADTVGDGPFGPLDIGYWGDGNAATVVHDEHGRTDIGLVRDGANATVLVDGPGVVEQVSVPTTCAGSLAEVVIGGQPTVRHPAAGWAGACDVIQFSIGST
jgi:alpha-D-xyloside xylohydrolase